MKMKNKKENQRGNKQRHLNEIGRDKRQRREEPKLNRRRATRTALPIILIVCEGKNTEPSYFNQFKLKSIEVEPKGDGYSHYSLVMWAKKLANQKKYEEIWCVFDADPKADNPNWVHNFNKAIWTAKKLGYEIGYSHQAFEYWLLLHFEDHQGGSMCRSDYNTRLNKLIKPLGAEYEGDGSKVITPELFSLLEGVDATTGKPRKELAICRAKRIYDKYNHSNPAKEESSTTVFELVIKLMNFESDNTKIITTNNICD